MSPLLIELTRRALFACVGGHVKHRDTLRTPCRNRIPKHSGAVYAMAHTCRCDVRVSGRRRPRSRTLRAPAGLPEPPVEKWRRKPSDLAPARQQGSPSGLGGGSSSDEQLQPRSGPQFFGGSPFSSGSFISRQRSIPPWSAATFSRPPFWRISTARPLVSSAGQAQYVTIFLSFGM